MTYYGTPELAASFRTVRKNTIIIADEIGEEHYGFSAAPNTRTVAQTLAHIALTPKFAEQIHAIEHRSTMEGFDYFGFFGKLTADEQSLTAKKQIIARLTEEGDRFAKWIETLSEDFLGERVALPTGMTPPDKSRFEMILGVKEHEMHHRSQVMVMERMLGIVPHLTRDMEARIATMQAASKASA
jgi:uncharacterized damage-inducible protein DinB